MKSSYTTSKLNYGDILSTITQLKKPKKIIEFGILDGFSLKTFVENSSSMCQIKAYDIFEDFVGNGANQKTITDLFSNNANVLIEKQDFYNLDFINSIENNSIDILHIDIANNGYVYEFAIEHYLKKVSKTGAMLFEGGSEERDNVEWMLKYNKAKIQPILKKHSNSDMIDIYVLDKYPSMTLITFKE